MKKRELIILITSILVGMLIILQGKAFVGLSQDVRREARMDIFRELKTLKNTNDNLEDEVKSLEDQVGKMNGMQDALQAVAADIEKYRIASGQVDVNGPGIFLAVKGDIKALWLTDITNELFLAGAEAVSVNGIRLTKHTSGFDTLPNGQIMLNSVILKSPYDIQAIGDRKTLADALSQPQGILQRLKENLPDIATELAQKDLVQMDKVM